MVTISPAPLASPARPRLAAPTDRTAGAHTPGAPGAHAPEAPTARPEPADATQAPPSTPFAADGAQPRPVRDALLPATLSLLAVLGVLTGLAAAAGWVVRLLADYVLG